MDVQAGGIGKTDECPCGSGKNYEDCCEELGITYGLFEFGNRKVVFNVKEVDLAIQDLLGFLSDEVSNTLPTGF
jgi:hypothetical protein